METDRFCRGCLIRYEEPTELLQYTEKNRRLFLYSTGLQVKRNDTFTFQLCKDCYLNMKAACNFKKQCRSSDKKFRNYLALKETGESVDLPAFLKNNDDSWTFRFPAMYGNSTPAQQKIKDEDNESTTTSICNFISDLMPEAELPDTEARIIREVIEEAADLLDDSLDSHWLQDDASINTDFRLDFSFSPFSTPRQVNTDRYTPQKVTEDKSTDITDEHKQNYAIAKKILDMPIINEESNHASVPVKVEKAYDEEIDSLDAVNDILQYESEYLNEIDKKPPPQCTIDRNLEEALKNSNNKEFSLDELLVSPRVVPGIQSPPTPLINNILFGEKLDDESSNSSQTYKAGQCVETYENVEGDVEMTEFLESRYDTKIESPDSETKVERTDKDEPFLEIKNQFNVTNFYCKMCERTFNTLRGLKQHSSKHNKAKAKRARVMICDYCGKQSNDRTNLLRHIQIHMREPPPKYECKLCKMEFSSKATLQMHERTHTGKKHTPGPKVKRFVCTVCGISTDKASNFKLHMKRHEKKFTIYCPECDKGFYRPAELTIHMRYHTGEKPFACTLCDRTFTRRDGLTRHIKWHLDLKPFQCDFCKTRFINSTYLKNHFKKSLNCNKSKDLLAEKQKRVDEQNSTKSYVTEEIHMKAQDNTTPYLVEAQIT